MIRWLIALTSVLAVLVLVENYAVKRQRQHDALHGTLRPLATVNKDDVAGIVAVAGNGRTWRYVRVDSTWRYPAFLTPLSNRSASTICSTACCRRRPVSSPVRAEICSATDCCPTARR